MRKLAPLAGRGQAHDIVHYALESGGTDALCNDSNITAHFSETQIETALDPSHYLGESVEIARLSAILAEGIANRLNKGAKWRVNSSIGRLTGIIVDLHQSTTMESNSGFAAVIFFFLALFIINCLFSMSRDPFELMAIFFRVKNGSPKLTCIIASKFICR